MGWVGDGRIPGKGKQKMTGVVEVDGGGEAELREKTACRLPAEIPQLDDEDWY